MKNSFKIPFIMLVALLLGSIASQAQSTQTKKGPEPSATATVVKKEKKNTSTKAYLTKSRTPMHGSSSTTSGKVKKDKTAARTTAPATHKTMAMSQTHNTSGDKVHGKDNNGHTLYQSPNGGIYYFNAQGKKEYVKRDH